jgi:hypothetical protein
MPDSLPLAEAEASRAWTDAAHHWTWCPTCQAAGGEWAHPTKMCVVGAMLNERWDRAEMRAARLSHPTADR